MKLVLIHSLNVLVLNRNILADSKNIHFIGSHSGNITSCSSNILAADSIIINDSLSGMRSQRREVDLLIDPMVTSNSNDGDQELPTDITGVLVDTIEALWVSENNNIIINNNINNGISSDIAANNDFNLRTAE